MNDSKSIKKILSDHERRIKNLEKKLSNPISKKIKSGNKSAMDFLIEMKEDKFFNEPRLIMEIINELARRGHHYKRTSLTNTMQRVIRKKLLGRIGKKRKWRYVNR